MYKTAPSDTERLLATLTMGLAIQPHNYHMRKLRARVAIVLHDLDVVTADDLLAQDLEARAIVGRAREMKALQLREAEVQHRRPCSVARQLAGPEAATSAADLSRDPVPPLPHPHGTVTRESLGTRHVQVGTRRTRGAKNEPRTNAWLWCFPVAVLRSSTGLNSVEGSLSCHSRVWRVLGQSAVECTTIATCLSRSWQNVTFGI